MHIGPVHDCTQTWYIDKCCATMRIVPTGKEGAYKTVPIQQTGDSPFRVSYSQRQAHTGASCIQGQFPGPFLQRLPEPGFCMCLLRML